MAIGHVDPGKTIIYTNVTTKTITVNTIIQVGELAGIALGDIAAGGTGEIGIAEIWNLPKDGAKIDQGAKCYLKSGKITATAGNEPSVGICTAAAVAGDTTVNVLLNGR